MTEFDAVLERRTFLQCGFVLGLAAFAGVTAPVSRTRASGGFDFEPVAANSLDTITLPDGFEWHVVGSWGDPLWSDGPEFDQRNRGNARSQAMAFGDNCDGMGFFTVDGHHLLLVNNEYCNHSIMFGSRDSGSPENADDVVKTKNAHGVTQFEIAQRDGRWRIVRDSPYNRRLTADSPMEITGPARGHDFMKTTADPAGIESLGTWNNCGNGKTPWGTFLTCEENFNDYFATPSQPEFALGGTLQRYGIRNEDWGDNWSSIDPRFDVALHPNEPHRVGYVVEIDPARPQSTPKKRTAMGRLKHENCEIVISDDDYVVAYMGDDERGEFLYRFVSAGKFVEGDDDNTNLLEDGTLYAARFDDDGNGRWLALTPETTGMSREEICIFSRIAASKVGATTMDRPEWVAVNPHKTEAYCCLTNNRNRGVRPNAGGDEMPVGGPNPRAKNRYGQIVRWIPAAGRHTAEVFEWDLFATAGNPDVHSDDRAGSDNITPENMFNSPDGLAFDSRGNLWIQTDGRYSNEGDFAGMGNNQMLLGNPDTGEIRRFLVGPKECEITGIDWSSDRQTMFVGVQHPGEQHPEQCHFPDGGDSVPRSSVIAITRSDGGLMG